jgi:hypothetical protein
MSITGLMAGDCGHWVEVIGDNELPCPVCKGWVTEEEWNEELGMEEEND